jgi:hypothetical protein
MGKFKKANSNGKGLSHPAVKVLIFLNIILLGGGLYIYYRDQPRTQASIPVTEQETASQFKDDLVGDSTDNIQPDVVIAKRPLNTQEKVSGTDTRPATTITPPIAKTKHLSAEKTSTFLREVESPTLLIQAKNNRSTTRYTVAKGLAHFHNQPDPSTKRKAFINHWNKAVLEPLDEQNGFIYIVYTNHLGQTSKGWLQIKDLKRIANK